MSADRLSHRKWRDKLSPIKIRGDFVIGHCGQQHAAGAADIKQRGFSDSNHASDVT
jgi:hypothetical protein